MVTREFYFVQVRATTEVCSLKKLKTHRLLNTTSRDLSWKEVFHLKKIRNKINFIIIIIVCLLHAESRGGAGVLVNVAVSRIIAL